jgi:hypothetical protein
MRADELKFVVSGPFLWSDTGYVWRVKSPPSGILKNDRIGVHANVFAMNRANVSKNRRLSTYAAEKALSLPPDSPSHAKVSCSGLSTRYLISGPQEQHRDRSAGFREAP